MRTCGFGARWSIGPLEFCVSGSSLLPVGGVHSRKSGSDIFPTVWDDTWPGVFCAGGWLECDGPAFGDGVGVFTGTRFPGGPTMKM